jgi:hypothetical protein
VTYNFPAVVVSAAKGNGLIRVRKSWGAWATAAVAPLCLGAALAFPQEATPGRRDLEKRAVENAILAAADFYRAGDAERAWAYLAVAKPDLKRGSERDRRRWVSKRGKRADEARYLRELVEYPASWPSGLCQGCHANPDAPRETPLLDLRGWWPIERYVALLRSGKGAAAEEAKEARAVLEFNPDDRAAQLRLHCALRALGRDKEAEALLRRVPWLKFDARTGVAPIEIRAFP